VHRAGAREFGTAPRYRKLRAARDNGLERIKIRPSAEALVKTDEVEGEVVRRRPRRRLTGRRCG